MLSRYKFVCLLVTSSLFAATAAAQTPTVRVARASERAESAAPRVLWKDVRVEFEGNSVFASERLRELTKECYGRRAGDEQEEFDPEKLNYCLRKLLLDHMRHAGYLRAKFGEPRVESNLGGATVTVPLEENELYRLGEIKIEGAEFFTPARLRELLPLKRGDAADGGALAAWVYERVRDLYGDEGFIQYEPEIDPTFRLDPGSAEGVADFTVTVNEGQRFRLRRLAFKIHGDVPEDVAREAMLIKEGDLYSARKFAESIERLSALGVFGEVNGNADADFFTDEKAGAVDVTIRLAVTGQAPAPR